MRRWLWLLLFSTAACGRVGFGAGDTSLDASSDGMAPDAAPMDAMLPDGTIDAPADVASDTEVLSDAETGGGLPTSATYFAYESVRFGDNPALRAADGLLIGDVSLRPGASGTWMIVIRYATLAAGVPSEMPTLIRATLTREGEGRYFFSPVDDSLPNAVFLVSNAGTRWTFILDQSDPRSAAAVGEYADESVLVLEDVPTMRTEGSWVARSITAGGSTVSTGECAPYADGFVTANVGYQSDPLGPTLWSHSFVVYADVDCTSELMRSVADHVGFVIEQPDGVVEGYFWEALGSDGVYTLSDFSFPEKGVLRLDNRECSTTTCSMIESMELVPVSP